MPEEFDDLVDHLRIHSSKFMISPEYWATYSGPDNLNWEIIKFEKDTIEDARGQLQGRIGVYTLVIKSGVANHPHGDFLVYVGKTEDQDFYTRWLQELRLPTQTIPKQVRLRNFIKLWGSHMWAYFTEMTDSIDSIEQALQNAWIPPANDKLPGRLRMAINAFS